MSFQATAGTGTESVATPGPLFDLSVIEGVWMRYLILGPVCAALLGTGAANAQGDSHGFIDAQAYSSAPHPVVAPVPPQWITGQPACDAQRHGYQPQDNAAIGAALLPYHPPVLPPPSTLYGYFNSPPEHLHLWDSYPQEVALRQWHRAAKARQARGGRHAHAGGGHPSVEPCH